MTRLPGRSLLAPRDPAGWARQLAEALARVHDPALGRRGLGFVPDLEAEVTRALAAPAERVGAGQPKGPQRLRHPAGPALWAALRAGWPRVRSGPPVLVHRDYHPSNTVWLRGRLAGVVDWDDAARGPPGYDLAMCRVELALLSGPGAAAAFLRAYEAAAGRPAADVAFWDLYRAWWTLPDPERWLPGLHRLGRTGPDGRPAPGAPGRLHRRRPRPRDVSGPGASGASVALPWLSCERCHRRTA